MLSDINKSQDVQTPFTFCAHQPKGGVAEGRDITYLSINTTRNYPERGWFMMTVGGPPPAAPTSCFHAPLLKGALWGVIGLGPEQPISSLHAPHTHTLPSGQIPWRWSSVLHCAARILVSIGDSEHGDVRSFVSTASSPFSRLLMTTLGITEGTVAELRTHAPRRSAVAGADSRISNHAHEFNSGSYLFCYFAIPTAVIVLAASRGGGPAVKVTGDFVESPPLPSLWPRFIRRWDVLNTHPVSLFSPAAPTSNIVGGRSGRVSESADHDKQRYYTSGQSAVKTIINKTFELIWVCD